MTINSLFKYILKYIFTVNICHICWVTVPVCQPFTDTKLQTDKEVLEEFESILELQRILTRVRKFPPASGITECSIVDLTGAFCKADGPDVVSESDGAAEFHEGNVIVKQGLVPVRMDDDPRHCAVHLINIQPTLSLSSKVDNPV